MSAKENSSVVSSVPVLPVALHERLVARKCIAYVGAGFSMACGMPDWSGLLKTLLKRARLSLRGRDTQRRLDYCSRLINSSKNVQAASVICTLMPRSFIDSEIQKCFGRHVLGESSTRQQSQMEARLSYLLDAPWAGIITTNYDTLIEDAIAVRKLSIQESDGYSERLGVLLSDVGCRRFYLKLHGSVSAHVPVLTTEDYGRLYIANPRIRTLLQAIMLHYSIVFIGCSLTDEVVNIRRQLSVHYGGIIPPAFCFFPNTEENIFQCEWLAETAQVYPMLYDCSIPHHGGLDRLLAECSARRDISPIPLGSNVTQIDELRNLELKDRIEQIGAANIDVLQAFCNRIGATVTHAELIIDWPMNSRLPEVLKHATPEERLYRIQFLVAAGFLDEYRDNGGIVRYAINPRVAALLSGRKKNVAGIGSVRSSRGAK